MDTKCRKVKPGGETGLFLFLGGRAACCVAHSDMVPVSAFAATSPPVPSRTPRNEYPLLSFLANSCGWRIPPHLQRVHRRAGHAPEPGPSPERHSEMNRGSGSLSPSPEPGKPLWLPECPSLLHHNQTLAAYTDLLSFSIALGASRERERERKSEVRAHFVFTSVPTM